MGGGTSRREFLTKALYGVTLEVAGPAPSRGSFVPFYEVSAGTPYEMSFNLT